MIPRHENSSIGTANHALQCAGKIGTRVLEDEMYMSSIIMMAEDMSMRWWGFPLDQWPTLEIHWEYGVCYPLTRYFDVVEPLAKMMDLDDDENDQDRENEKRFDEFLGKLKDYNDALLYVNPMRHSLMLFVVESKLGEGGPGCMQRVRVGGESDETLLADGGDDWHPVIELAHEFSLIPALQPVEDPKKCLKVPPMMRSRRSTGGCMATGGGGGRASDALHASRIAVVEGSSSLKKLWGGVTPGCTTFQVNIHVPCECTLVDLTLMVCSGHAKAMLQFNSHAHSDLYRVFRTCRTSCSRSDSGRCPTFDGQACSSTCRWTRPKTTSPACAGSGW